MASLPLSKMSCTSVRDKLSLTASYVQRRGGAATYAILILNTPPPGSIAIWSSLCAVQESTQREAGGGGEGRSGGTGVYDGSRLTEWRGSSPFQRIQGIPGRALCSWSVLPSPRRLVHLSHSFPAFLEYAVPCDGSSSLNSRRKRRRDAADSGVSMGIICCLHSSQSHLLFRANYFYFNLTHLSYRFSFRSLKIYILV